MSTPNVGFNKVQAAAWEYLFGPDTGTEERRNGGAFLVQYGVFNPGHTADFTIAHLAALWANDYKSIKQVICQRGWERFLTAMKAANKPTKPPTDTIRVTLDIDVERTGPDKGAGEYIDTSQLQASPIGFGREVSGVISNALIGLNTAGAIMPRKITAVTASGMEVIKTAEGLVKGN